MMSIETHYAPLLRLPRKPARKKSKAEVMAEVIAKSKEHKVSYLHTARDINYLIY